MAQPVVRIRSPAFGGQPTPSSQCARDSDKKCRTRGSTGKVQRTIATPARSQPPPATATGWLAQLKPFWKYAPQPKFNEVTDASEMYEFPFGTFATPTKSSRPTVSGSPAVSSSSQSPTASSSSKATSPSQSPDVSSPSQSETRFKKLENVGETVVVELDFD